jgi:Tol biopolymer transport system component
VTEHGSESDDWHYPPGMKRLSVIAALIGVGLIATAALVVVPGVAAGSPSSQGTLLIVSASTTTHPGLVRVSLVDVASGRAHAVLQGKGIWGIAAWSPDGKWIALARGDGVVLLGGDGRGLRQLPQLAAQPARAGMSFREFAWAPNSRSLAISEPDGHRLVIRGINGGARAIMRTGSATVMLRVSWSPDGRWISYYREGFGGGNGVGCCSLSIHLIHPDGSGDHSVVVMHEPHDTPSAALWAPDGHRFAFSTEARDAHDPSLALVDPNSGTVTAFPMPNAVPVGWSADGRELDVVRSGAPPSLMLIDVSGHGRALATVLPPSPFAGAWSPDGTRLVISGSQTSRSGKIRAVDLEIVDPGGGPARVLAQLPQGSQVQVLAWRRAPA